MGDMLDTESFRQMIQSLKSYVDDMSNCLEEFKRATQECDANLGSDEIGQATIANAESCKKKLESTVLEASELQKKLETKIANIEQTINDYRNN